MVLVISKLIKHEIWKLVRLRKRYSLNWMGFLTYIYQRLVLFTLFCFFLTSNSHNSCNIQRHVLTMGIMVCLQCGDRFISDCSWLIPSNLVIFVYFDTKQRIDISNRRNRNKELWTKDQRAYIQREGLTARSNRSSRLHLTRTDGIVYRHIP
jgi:hypothetical protein